jgi:hypothetical protein
MYRRVSGRTLIDWLGPTFARYFVGDLDPAF